MRRGYIYVKHKQWHRKLARRNEGLNCSRADRAQGTISRRRISLLGVGNGGDSQRCVEVRAILTLVCAGSEPDR